jgi:hypothetical protein
MLWLESRIVEGRFGWTIDLAGDASSRFFGDGDFVQLG